MRSRWVAGLVLSTVASAANAGVITFDFSGSDGSLGTTASFTSGGVTIDVTGYYWANFTTFGLANVYRLGGALGIDNPQDADTAIDNSGSYDLLLIDLRSLFGPITVEFSGLGSDDDWRVGWDDGSDSASSASPAAFWASIDGLHTCGTNPYTVNTPSRYLLVGGSALTSSNDEFYVTKLTIRTVPEPGTLGLLGAGLLGLGAVFRRRRYTS